MKILLDPKIYIRLSGNSTHIRIASYVAVLVFYDLFFKTNS